MVDQITTPPAAPLRSEPTTFAERREAWLLWEEGGLVPGLNATISAFNPLISRYEELLGVANLVGYWADQTGPASPPMAVLHDYDVPGEYDAYYLVNATTNIAADEPGVSTKWVRVVSESWRQIGATQTYPGAPFSAVTFSTGLSAYRDLMIVVEGLGHNSGSDQTWRLIPAGSNGTFTGSSATGDVSSAWNAATTLNGTITILNRDQDLASVVGRLAQQQAAGSASYLTGLLKPDLFSNGGVHGVRIQPSGGSINALTSARIYGRGAPL